jgi:hypothetical protein
MLSVIHDELGRAAGRRCSLPLCHVLPAEPGSVWFVQASVPAPPPAAFRVDGHQEPVCRPRRLAWLLPVAHRARRLAWEGLTAAAHSRRARAASLTAARARSSSHLASAVDRSCVPVARTSAAAAPRASLTAAGRPRCPRSLHSAAPLHRAPLAVTGRAPRAPPCSQPPRAHCQPALTTVAAAALSGTHLRARAAPRAA